MFPCMELSFIFLPFLEQKQKKLSLNKVQKALKAQSSSSQVCLQCSSSSALHHPPNLAVNDKGKSVMTH